VNAAILSKQPSVSSPPRADVALRECLGRSLAVGVFLGFVDTAFTYTTSHAPFVDAALIVAVPLVIVSALALLALGITRLVGRSDSAPRAVQATLLIAPVVVFGARGCIAGCGVSGWNLFLRWLPTASLATLLIIVVAWGGSQWSPLLRLLVLAGTTQVLAALTFGIRTDEYPTMSIEPVLLCVALLSALVIAWRVGGQRWVSSGPRVALVVVGLSTAVAWVLRAVPPHLPRAAASATAAGRPNVLLIVLDTVRADHLSLYGYRRRTSPNLDQLAVRSLVFDRARANATYSLASHASLFTGLPPSGHGARPIPNNWLERHPTLNLAARSFRVREDVPTIAQDLKTLGYSTAGVSANDVYLARWTGLQRGFDAFEAKARRRYRFSPLSAPFVAQVLPRLGVSQVTFFQDTWRAPDITEAAIGWLKTAPSPFFLFLNYFDAHSPYDPPGGSPFRGDGVGRDGDVADYDGEIAFLDAHLGRLLQFMRDRGLLERTIVIITSDHGEYFDEHGLRGHPAVLYEPVLSVPLIVRLPGGLPTGRVARWTGLHEVRGLVREVLGGLRPLSILGERSAPAALAQAWSEAAGDATIEAEPSSSVVYFGDLKLIANRSGGGALFDLTDDPREDHDLLRGPSRMMSATYTATYTKMRQALALGAAARMGESPEAPPEAIERLRALGYVQ
jgi:arylsulfatase A-like enzyme